MSASRPEWPVLPDDIGEVRLVAAVDAEWTPEGWQGATWTAPDHIGEHFAADGLCQCPCEDCTTRLAKFCVCLDCPCDPDDPEAPDHGQEQFGDD